MDRATAEARERKGREGEETTRHTFRFSYKSYMLANFSKFDDVEVKLEGESTYLPAIITSHIANNSCLVVLEGDDTKREIRVDIRKIQYPEAARSKDSRKNRMEFLRRAAICAEEKNRKEEEIQLLKSARELKESKLSKDREMRANEVARQKVVNKKAEFVFSLWRKGENFETSNVSSTEDNHPYSSGVDARWRWQNYKRIDIEVLNRARILYENYIPLHEQLEVLPARGWLAGNRYIKAAENIESQTTTITSNM